MAPALSVSTAQPEWAISALARQMYVGHYSRDEEFCSLLETFYRERARPVGSLLLRPGSLEMIRHQALNEYDLAANQYGRDLQILAENAALHRLRDPAQELSSFPELSFGALLIHRWCVARAEAESKDRKYGPERFLQGDFSAGPSAEIGNSDQPPLVDIHVMETWEPGSTTRKKSASA